MFQTFMKENMTLKTNEIAHRSTLLESGRISNETGTLK